MGDQDNAVAMWEEKLNSSTEIKLQKHRLKDHECSHLGLALREKVTVQSLKLRSDGMGVIGLTAIAEALAENTSLTEFELSGNNGVGDEGAEIIAEAVKANGRLRSLQLCGFGIGREGAGAIAAILRFGKSLVSLGLEKNNIRADGALALSQILKTNTTLMELNIINNNIGDVGAEHMADFLRFNKSLQVLYLQQNHIGDDGVSHLSEALKVNTTLTTLGLGSNNNISPAGCLVVAQGLKDNSSLAWLSGIDLSSFAQDIFGLSKKQMEKIDWAGDMNNTQLLHQAQITRELTRIRYENLTVKYKKDSKSLRPVRRNQNVINSNSVLTTRGSRPSGDVRSVFQSKGQSNNSMVSKVTGSGSKRLLSSTTKMSIDESSMKPRSKK